MTIPKSALFEWLDDFYTNALTEGRSYEQWAQSLLALDEPDFTENERMLLRQCVLKVALTTELDEPSDPSLLTLAEKLAPPPPQTPVHPAGRQRIHPRLTVIRGGVGEEPEEDTPA